MRRLLAGLALLVALVAAPSPFDGDADAARWHPALRWHTLDTAHFSIHFHQGGEQLAEEMALLAEEVHTILAPYVGWQPRGRTQVTLVDSTDAANGFARTVPGNQIVLFVVQPTPDTSLDGYEDWWFALFVHEYAHILQIDMAEDALQLLRFVAGRLVVPGGVLPRWMSEGFATWIETVTTTGGRGRSTYTDMLLRTAALEGRFPRIDVADGLGSRFPRGQLRYLYGVRFHLEVAGRTSNEAWIDFHHLHARGLIPYVLPAKRAFGERFAPMWRRWREEASARYLSDAEQLQAQGVTATRIVPTRAGEALRPRYSRDSLTLVYSHRSPTERSAIRQVRRDGTGDRRIHRGGVDGTVIDAPGRAWVAMVGNTGRYTRFNDLFTLDLATGKTSRVTVGRRLTSPAPHPDGWVLAVTTSMGQSQLARVDLPPDPPEPQDGGSTGAAAAAPPALRDAPTSGPEESRTQRSEDAARVTLLTAADDGSQYANPVWDPSGTRLAVSIWKPGGFRDIHVFDRDLALVRTLTWDRATDADPVWSPDGQWLLWASDRDGIWNLYASRSIDGAVFRVTRLIGGARHPDVSPDGRWIAFQGFSAEGWRVEELPFVPATWERVLLSARVLPGPQWGPSQQALAPVHPLEGLPGPAAPWGTGPQRAIARDRTRADYTTLAAPPEDPIELTPQQRRRLRIARSSGVATPHRADTVDIPEALGSVRRYNPLRTLFPPRYISPFGTLTDTGAVGGLGVGGYDALEQHFWNASIQYRTDSRYIGWAAGYSLNAFRPRFSVSFSTISLDYGRLWRRNKEPDGPIGVGLPGSFRAGERYFERRDRLNVGVSVPVKTRHNLSAWYKAEFRRPLRDLPPDVDPRLLPARGSFSGLVLGWAWGQFRRFPASISPEDDSRLLSVSVDLESSFLGAYRVSDDGSREQLHRGIVTVEGRTYQTMPWLRNHVVALRFAGGATLGTQIPQRTFRIGGPYGDSPYVSLPDRYYALRGYPTSSMRGDHVYLGSIEYRLPLLLIERGLLTAPVWLRSVSAVIFAEAGQTFDTSTYAEYRGSPAGFFAFWRATRPSVGVELVGDAVLGWGGVFTGRIGYAYGFGEGALPTGAVYAQLGTSF